MSGITPSHLKTEQKFTPEEVKENDFAKGNKTARKLRALNRAEREKLERGVVLLQRQIRCRKNKQLRAIYQMERNFFKKRNPLPLLRATVVSDFRQVSALFKEWLKTDDRLLKQTEDQNEKILLQDHQFVVCALQSFVMEPSRSFRCICICDEQGKMQGVALFSTVLAKQPVFLSDLCTAPENLLLRANAHRRRGMGSALIAEIIRVNRISRGVGAVYLLALENSMTFYSHLGFEKKQGGFYCLSEYGALHVLKSYGIAPPTSILKDDVFWYTHLQI